MRVPKMVKNGIYSFFREIILWSLSLLDHALTPQTGQLQPQSVRETYFHIKHIGKKE
jgi:hypothetical protein